MKKKVIGYVHFHWDREWYREFEIFRLRLLRVFDNVLNLLEQDKIPSFYFDGQVSALLDYLELRPEKEALVRKFISEKRLFIGPCYTLVDEYLTDKNCFEKNLETGLKISREFGCTEFIGYLADTFGHSKNIPKIFKEYGIDKCMVWRGCGDIPSEFVFNGINTVNMIRGYFMDIFSAKMTIRQKADWLKGNLDKIAEKSKDVLLLPVGADHLGVEENIAEQINKVNTQLKDYEIELSNPFRYFELVKNNFKYKWNDELRDNSKTFILQGCYSARTKIKQANTTTSYKLSFADKMQKEFGENYTSAINYGYKLLLQNQAHDGICGCSTDAVHQENLIRYQKVNQVADTILRELKFQYPKKYASKMKNHNKKYRAVMEFENTKTTENSQIISAREGFEDSLLYNTQRIPITEDYTTIYKYLQEIKTTDDKLKISKNTIANNYISLNLKNNEILINRKIKLDFVRYNDYGDTYNYGAKDNDTPEIAKIYSSEIICNGDYRKGLRIKTSFFDVDIWLDIDSKILKFDINWNNSSENKIWQARFTLPEKVYHTCSEDMNRIIKREFEADYNMRENLPKTKGIEVKTNFAPMQRYVGTQGFGIITRGLTEYEVYENTLSITLLRSIGIISNPQNPSRTTPAGPPIKTPEAQQLGLNEAKFATGFFEPSNYNNYVEEYYSEIINL